MTFQNMTIGEALATFRDFTVVVGLPVVGWKARSLFQPALDFFRRANHHMEVVEAGIHTILTNHLKHMEEDLRVMAGREVQSVRQTGPVSVQQTGPVSVVSVVDNPLSVSVIKE